MDIYTHTLYLSLYLSLHLSNKIILDLIMRYEHYTVVSAIIHYKLYYDVKYADQCMWYLSIFYEQANSTSSSLTCNHGPCAAYGFCSSVNEPTTLDETNVIAVSLSTLLNVKCRPCFSRPLSTQWQ